MFLVPGTLAAAFDGEGEFAELEVGNWGGGVDPDVDGVGGFGKGDPQGDALVNLDADKAVSAVRRIIRRKLQEEAGTPVV